MSKPQVLLITHTKDNQSIPMVEEAIRRRGGEAIRLDTDRYPLDVKINTRYENSGWAQRLKTPNGDIDLTELTAVWYRRFYAGHGLPETRRFVRSFDSRVTTDVMGEHCLFVVLPTRSAVKRAPRRSQRSPNPKSHRIGAGYPSNLIHQRS